MSHYEFEQQIRQSDRFWDSKRALDEGMGLVNFINNKLMGVG